MLVYSDNVEKSSQLILDYINDLDLQKNNVENSVNFVSKKFNKEIFSAKIKSLISNL